MSGARVCNQHISARRTSANTGTRARILDADMKHALEMRRLKESGGETGAGVFAGVSGKRQRVDKRAEDESSSVRIGAKYQATVCAEPTFDSRERGDQLVLIERVVVPCVMALSFVSVPAPHKKAEQQFVVLDSDTESPSDDEEKSGAGIGARESNEHRLHVSA